MSFRHQTDTADDFWQEPFFHHLFGVEEPGCFAALDLRTEQSYLFIPDRLLGQELLFGEPLSLTDCAGKYGVDEVDYVADMPEVMRQLAPPTVHLLAGTDADRCAVCVARGGGVLGLCDREDHGGAHPGRLWHRPALERTAGRQCGQTP